MTMNANALNTTDNTDKPWQVSLSLVEFYIASIRTILRGEPLMSPGWPDNYYGDTRDVIVLFKLINEVLAELQCDVVRTHIDALTEQLANTGQTSPQA